MKVSYMIKITFIIAILFIADQAEAVRVKDVASIKGVRPNQLVGYGLVVGLDGTGDDDKTEFTNQTLLSMLEKMGIVIKNADNMKVDNCAGVMVTATLPPFAKTGTRIDVQVSTIGNADSLQGGTLLMTPLKSPDGDVYAVAQGPISIGGFSFGGAAGGGVQKNHPTGGMIPGGAIVEREVQVQLSGRDSIEIALNRPDFTTALRLARTVGGLFGNAGSQAVDSGTVRVAIPAAYADNIVEFISRVENLDIRPDGVARVVLNERTGTVVMGEKVRLSTVAISHGNLSIVIKEQPAVSQPLPFSAGETAVVPQTEVTVEEQKSNLILVPEGASIGEVIRGLNAIGVSSRDLIAILQAIKAAGALQAELEVI